MCILLLVSLPMSLFTLPVSAEDNHDFTCFQIAAPYSPQLDIGSDMAVVYGMTESFADRVAGWREQGYSVGMMTGISWGGYDDYYMTANGFKKAEVQTTKTGRLYMHGNSKTVGYNVPTSAYVEYIKRKISPAIELGVHAIYLEEPEYWAETGWSDAFKSEWQRFYGEAWMAPNSSVDAQYRASKLKYHLYYDALREVQEYIKERADELGHTVECHVPTHSLNNYAHWRIVSPMSSLMELQAMDGYIAQVWTGTARTPNIYRGVRKERTFETAFLEYGQMLSMVRPTDRKVWFLADPIEDNPNYSWNNYKWNYECTIIASLLWSEVSHYEVMPWPDRIFQGTYPKVDMEKTSGDREGIPAEYATQLLAVINALNNMEQSDISHMCGTRGIGVLVSDTMMFQRAEPNQSDPDMGSFYGLALPLLKLGIPVEPVQLETIKTLGALDRYQLLLLTYEGQKPLLSEYHDQLTAWVKKGGMLLFVDDGSDPYNHVREWWNGNGKHATSPGDDLLKRLGVQNDIQSGPQPVGEGYIWVISASPQELQRIEAGAAQIQEAVKELLMLKNIPLEIQNYLGVQRGPYIVASVLDESISEEPLIFRGSYIDIFNPLLPWIDKRVLIPNERTLLYDIGWAKENGMKAGVLAAAARIREEQLKDNTFTFSMRGPANTTGRARVLLPGAPVLITSTPKIDMEQKWHEQSSTLWISFPNTAASVSVTILFDVQ